MMTMTVDHDDVRSGQGWSSAELGSAAQSSSTHIKAEPDAELSAETNGNTTQQRSKLCTRCKVAQPCTAFFKDNSKAMGFTSWCKGCFSEYCQDKECENSAGPSVEERCCRICKLTKPADDFVRDSRRNTGLDARCKVCRREQHRTRKESRAVGRPTVVEKQCRRCGSTKPAGDFKKHAYTSSGLDSWCKACCSERRREKVKPRVYEPTIEHKECIRCRQDKPAGDFTRDTGKRTGLGARCKPCENEYRKEKRTVKRAGGVATTDCAATAITVTATASISLSSGGSLDAAGSGSDDAEATCSLNNFGPKTSTADAPTGTYFPHSFDLAAATAAADALLSADRAGKFACSLQHMSTGDMKCSAVNAECGVSCPLYTGSEAARFVAVGEGEFPVGGCREDGAGATGPSGQEFLLQLLPPLQQQQQQPPQAFSGAGCWKRKGPGLMGQTKASRHCKLGVSKALSKVADWPDEDGSGSSALAAVASARWSASHTGPLDDDATAAAPMALTVPAVWSSSYCEPSAARAAVAREAQWGSYNTCFMPSGARTAAAAAEVQLGGYSSYPGAEGSCTRLPAESRWSSTVVGPLAATTQMAEEAVWSAPHACCLLPGALSSGPTAPAQHQEGGLSPHLLPDATPAAEVEWQPLSLQLKYEPLPRLHSGPVVPQQHSVPAPSLLYPMHDVYWPGLPREAASLAASTLATAPTVVRAPSAHLQAPASQQALAVPGDGLAAVATALSFQSPPRVAAAVVAATSCNGRQQSESDLDEEDFGMENFTLNFDKQAHNEPAGALEDLALAVPDFDEIDYDCFGLGDYSSCGSGGRLSAQYALDHEASPPGGGASLLDDFVMHDPLCQLAVPLLLQPS